MENLFNWKIFLILLVLYLIIKIYRFSAYIKKYLVIYELNILEEELDNGEQYLKFRVNFGRGLFGKKYFNRIGELKSDFEITKDELMKILSLTEIKTFKDFNSKTKQNYKYVNSKKNLKHITIFFKSNKESVEE